MLKYHIEANNFETCPSSRYGIRASDDIFFKYFSKCFMKQKLTRTSQVTDIFLNILIIELYTLTLFSLKMQEKSNVL